MILSNAIMEGINYILNNGILLSAPVCLIYWNLNYQNKILLKSKIKHVHQECNNKSVLTNTIIHTPTKPLTADATAGRLRLGDPLRSTTPRARLYLVDLHVCLECTMKARILEYLCLQDVLRISEC